MRLTLILSVLALPALAQDGFRSSDGTLNATELSDLLTGQVIEFFDGSKSRYADDGAYIYTYTDDGPEWTGQFSILDNSEICVQFDNGSARCDFLVKDKDRLVLITEDGLRFPVRNRTVYQR